MFQKTTLILLLLVIVSCKNNEPAKKDKIKTTNWLIGKWENKSKEGKLSETWTKVNDSIFEGEAYFIKEKDTLHFEKIQLQQKDDKLLYISTIKGQNNNKPITFVHNDTIEKQLVFENSKNDYPQRISYSLINKDSLVISISGIQQEKPSSEKFGMKKNTIIK